MSLKDIISSDITNVFLNKEELAEEIQYNGHTILAIPSIGQTNEKGNTFTMEGSADRAFFAVSASDVPSPAQGDEIISRGKRWEVERYQPGLMHRIECISNESAVLFGR